MRRASSNSTTSRSLRVAGLLALMLAGAGAAASEPGQDERISAHLDQQEIRSAAEAAAAETRAQIAEDLANRMLGGPRDPRRVAATRGNRRG